MAIMLAKTYTAFKAAGAPEEEAQAAAEELADYENRLTSIDTRLGRVEARLDAIDQRFAMVDQRFAMVDQRINLLTWAVGINGAATIAIFGMLFALFSRVGDIAARLPAPH